jgi:hypothetical protein
MGEAIWNLNVPYPVKLFLWHACKNILPTRMNLVKRRVVEDGICPCCWKEEETIVHVLWLCPAAQDVWGGGSSIFQKCCYAGTSFMQIFECCLARFTNEELDLLAVLARRI